MEIFTNITLIIDETGFEDREGLKRIVTSYNHKTSGSCYRVRESFDVLGQLVKKLSTLNAATHPTPVNSLVMDYIYKRCAEKLGKIHGQSIVIDFRAANSDPQGTGQVTFRARNKAYSPDRVHLDFVRQRFITFYQRTASDLHQKDLHLAPQQFEDLQRRFPLLLFNRGPSNTTKICGPFAHVHKLEEYVSQNFKSSANGPAKNIPASSQSFKSNAPSLKHSKPPEDESCPICMELIPPEKKKALQCKHSFCKDCLQKAFVYKPVCPICGEVYGTLEGTQPDGGTMDIKRTSDSLPGYENHKTIVINYHIPNGIQKVGAQLHKWRIDIPQSKAWKHMLGWIFGIKQPGFAQRNDVELQRLLFVLNLFMGQRTMPMLPS
ncbi:hypothetical protein CHARACLAT_011874 [Characodon lateralis]|uniref:E3 ubiquitin-protein ligase n=1 Tax=Characodon lateralis TaxID=208331 RepID=A0ABU7DGA3_9TELE|nr:hypothetical protein [Characodon lateralis]